MKARWLYLLCFAACLSGPVAAERIKDLAMVQGVRSNQLIGYGLVVGLDGSGDQTTQTPFTVQSIANMLTQLGVNLPPAAATGLQLKNVAAVMVTASLPPFAKPGQTIDVTVSSLGNAKSLRGGTLLMTPLKGADGQVYAIAQGNVVIAGAGAAAAGSSVTVNHLSAGRIPAGATVERSVASPLTQGDTVQLELHSTDFTTANRVVQSINNAFGAGTAVALDGRMVQVRAPRDPSARVAFLAQVENLNVIAGDAPAKVVLNARTGSVVMNQAVQVDTCAVAHGNLSVTITNEPRVSQPGPLSGGQTVVTQQAQIEIKPEKGNLITIPTSVNLAEVVKALNAVGATPQDLLAILQAMKAAGALRAELEII
ncbi:flagellar basal body P-ring protein FlgI [Thiobacter aerophilum]|uniref:Flagellar P-ring protein n=1 Tax=Thiobacter aerophilum TaxID=3121275 RepID=A0ABV0EIP2_9BURK